MTFLRRGAMFLVVSFACIGIPALHAGTFMVKERCAQTDSPVTLGDFAWFEGDAEHADEGVLDRRMTIPFGGPALLAAAWIADAAGIDAGSVHGEACLWLPAALDTEAARALAHVLARAMRPRVAEAGSIVEFDDARRIAALAADLIAKGITPGDCSCALSVDGLFVDVGASGIEPIRVGVKWYSRVARMTKTVEAGKPVSPADIRFSWERTDSDIEGAIAALGDIRETETRQRVRKDEILTSAALRPARLVKAGDLVRVTYLRGVIAVELTGRAQETGERGDRINVKLSFGAGKSAVLAARITARGEVIIERS